MKSLQFAVNYHLQNQTVWIFSLLSGFLVTQTLPEGHHRKNSSYCVMPQGCYNTLKSPKKSLLLLDIGSYLLLDIGSYLVWKYPKKVKTSQAASCVPLERWEMVCLIPVHQTVASTTMHRKQLSLTESWLPYYFYVQSISGWDLCYYICLNKIFSPASD